MGREEEFTVLLNGMAQKPHGGKRRKEILDFILPDREGRQGRDLSVLKEKGRKGEGMPSTVPEKETKRNSSFR